MSEHIGAMPATQDRNTHASSYRESMLEHLFIGALMRALWLHDGERMEVLKPQVDATGYDVVLAARGCIRYVQLKASHQRAATPGVPVNLGLARQPGGCVIWMLFDQATLDFTGFRWFGGQPGAMLPDIASYPVVLANRRSAAGVKPERTQIRHLPRRAFARIDHLDQVIEALFGPQRASE